MRWQVRSGSCNGANLFRLDGRTAFVSGGRGHLGAAMTRALAEAGAHVIVNGRDAAALDAFAGDLRGRGLFGRGRPPSTPMMSRRSAAFFGGLKRLDVLVNNIGFMQVKSFAALEAAGFRRHLCQPPSPPPLKRCAPRCRR